MKPQLPKGCNRYGAQMGRRETIEADKGSRIHFYLRNILQPDGYDEQGAYWGIGSPVYWAHDPVTGTSLFFRAINRSEAANIVLSRFPNARFR